MELLPPLAARLANGCLGALGTAASAAYAAGAEGASALAAAGAVALGSGWLAVRGYRLRVVCADGRVTVHGFLRTRVIPRAAVSEVTDLPAVKWTTASGRRRWTPVTALIGFSGELPGIARDKRRGLAELRRWVRRTR